MVGIYQDSFISLLKERLGDPIKVTHKNIVCRCPWCETNINRKHYHFYISTQAPIFHCFYSECKQSGTIEKLFNKLIGQDTSEQYVDKSKIVEIPFSERVREIDIKYPEINERQFPQKVAYLRERLKFANIHIQDVNNLVLDINNFVDINNLKLDEQQKRLLTYLQSNFIGFVTEHSGLIVFRNIDRKSDFRFYKIEIKPTVFMDYYKIPGNLPDSNKVIIGEGILDIMAEQIFDITELKNYSRLYAACLSTNYDSLLKSIVYNEQIFKLDVNLLSDRGMSLKFYEKIKRENSHIIDKMTVYYGDKKDFGDVPSKVEKFII